MAPPTAQQRMRRAQQKLRLRGVTLTLDALKSVVAFLSRSSSSNPHDDDDDDATLEQIAQELDKMSCMNLTTNCVLLCFSILICIPRLLLSIGSPTVFLLLLGMKEPSFGPEFSRLLLYAWSFNAMDDD